jgi:hypothetical protein
MDSQRIVTEKPRTLLSELNDLLSEIKCHEDIIQDVEENTLNPAKVALAKARRRYAELKCFCKVGDKIQKGKEPPIIVSKISPSHGGFSLRAFKMKKNGEPYAIDHEPWVWSQDEWSEWSVVR